MSSMDKDIMKILLKVLQHGPKLLSKEAKEKLDKYSNEILDKERKKELEKLLEELENGNESSDNFL
jgi:tRNA(Phe) wybutosine-synthesizing methylase Tyw3